MECRAGRCKVVCPPGGCACLYVYATDSCDCERLVAEPNGWGSGLSLGNKISVSLSDLPRRPVARSSIGCSPGRSWWTLADSGYVIGPVALGLVTDAFGIEAALLIEIGALFAWRAPESYAGARSPS